MAVICSRKGGRQVLGETRKKHRRRENERGGGDGTLVHPEQSGRKRPGFGKKNVCNKGRPSGILRVGRNEKKKGGGGVGLQKGKEPLFSSEV